MAKWEYCELEITIGGPLSGVQGEATVFKAEGQHVVKKGRYGVLLAELGADGWEVVAASARTEAGMGSKHKIDYLLKRELNRVERGL